MTRTRGCARRSACTAAHSTNVLFTKSVPLPVSENITHEGLEHRRWSAARHPAPARSSNHGHTLRRLAGFRPRSGSCCTRARQFVAVRSPDVRNSGRARSASPNVPGLHSSCSASDDSTTQAWRGLERSASFKRRKQRGGAAVCRAEQRPRRNVSGPRASSRFRGTRKPVPLKRCHSFSVWTAYAAAVNLDDQPTRRVRRIEGGLQRRVQPAGRRHRSLLRQSGRSLRLRRSACASSWKRPGFPRAILSQPASVSTRVMPAVACWRSGLEQAGETRRATRFGTRCSAANSASATSEAPGQ